MSQSLSFANGNTNTNIEANTYFVCLCELQSTKYTTQTKGVICTAAERTACVRISACVSPTEKKTDGGREAD